MVAPGVSHDTQLLPRDPEVLQQLVAGATNKEIAALLHLSSKTVEVRASQIYTKLGVHSRTKAAVKEVSLVLVRPLYRTISFHATPGHLIRNLYKMPWRGEKRNPYNQ
ncbi:MAG: response regulator transcription factor [Roseiflexus sp.]|nr:response regulator transcription factor [Roseiflexus sp.]